MEKSDGVDTNNSSLLFIFAPNLFASSLKFTKPNQNLYKQPVIF